MSYLPRHEDFGPLASPAVHPKLNVPNKPSLVRRVFEAFMVSRQRDVDRQVARFLAGRSGGYLTDSLEREISQHLLSSGWGANSAAFQQRRFP